MAASLSSSQPSTSGDSSSPLITARHSVKEATRLIGRAVAEGMSRFAQDYLDKVERCRQEALKEVKDKNMLRQGPWYPSDLYTACEAFGDRAFIDFIRKYDKFVQGYMNSKKFIMRGPDASNLGHQFLYFRARPDQNPYELAMNATQEFAIIDCGVAVNIILIQVLARCLREEKFNLVFSENGLGHLNFSFVCKDTTDQSLWHFLKPTDACMRGETGSIGARPLELGQLVGFAGDPTYKQLYPYGAWGSFNAIYTEAEVGKQTFSGLGLDPNISEKTLCQSMVDHHNAESSDWHRKLPSDEYQQGEEGKKCLPMLDLVSHLSQGGVSSISTVPGFSNAIGMVLNVERILQIVKADNPRILMLCTLWKLSPCRITLQGQTRWNSKSPSYEYLSKFRKI